jgi:hypothetical protein
VSEHKMTKDQLLRELAAAFERLLVTATEAALHGVTQRGGTWGPREIVAHLAGWEVMASVRVPEIAAGMPPLEFADRTQETVMNDAINATIVTMIGDQSLDVVCAILRQAYERDVEMLRTMDERFFVPGEYVYERTNSVIEHCQEHIDQLAPRSS